MTGEAAIKPEPMDEEVVDGNEPIKSGENPEGEKGEPTSEAMKAHENWFSKAVNDYINLDIDGKFVYTICPGLLWGMTSVMLGGPEHSTYLHMTGLEQLALAVGPAVLIAVAEIVKNVRDTKERKERIDREILPEIIESWQKINEDLQKSIDRHESEIQRRASDHEEREKNPDISGYRMAVRDREEWDKHDMKYIKNYRRQIASTQKRIARWQDRLSSIGVKEENGN
jgi:hypothetical protein